MADRNTVQEAARQMLLADRDWQKQLDSSYFRELAHAKQQAFINELNAAIGGVPVAALDTAYMTRLIAALQENGDPVSVDAADEFQRLLDAAGVLGTHETKENDRG